MVVLYADGGCNPNPGQGRYGLVVERDETILTRFSHGIGHATNNIAEWRGAIAALDYIEAMKFQQAELRMDSKLVVEQMQGRWRVKHEGLKPYADVGKTLYAKLRNRGCKLTVRWIPRGQNYEADKMSKAR